MKKIAIRKHMPAILTYAGVCGVVGTAVMAVKATPKALSLIQLEKERINAELYKTAKENGSNKLKKYIKLKELKFIGPCIIMIIVCLAYYTKYITFIPNIVYWILNVISLLIAITYSIVNNLNLIRPILNKIKSKKGK